MKTRLYHGLFLCLSCTLLILFSCKKDGDNHVDPDGNPISFDQGLVSKFIEVDNGDTTSHQFFYSREGLVDSVVISQAGFGYTKVFQHSRDLIVSEVPYMGPGVWVDSTWLDADSRPTHTVKRVMGTVVDFRYLYNEAGELTHFINQYPGGTLGDTTVNIWSDGNLVAACHPIHQDTVYYHYDASKSYQRGEPRHLATLEELGRNTVPSVNLQTGLTQHGFRGNYVFKHDADGRIIYIAGEGGSNSSYILVEYQ